MPVSDQDVRALKKCCEDIVEKGRNLFSWQWDPYFESALTVIPVANQEEVSSLLEECCGHRVEDQLPEDLQPVMSRVGGLRAGQKAFLTDANKPAFVLVAWWPWGNGSSISIRVRLIAEGTPVKEGEKLFESFKSWFGVR